MSFCCPELDDVCELGVLVCSPEVEGKISDAILLDVGFGKAALEGTALVSACVVEIC